MDSSLRSVLAAIGSDIKALALGKADASHTHTIAQITGLQAALDSKPGATQQINAQTGAAYIVQASDAGKLVTFTRATPVTVTVPASILAAGQRVDMAALGDGMVTLTGSGGIVLTGTPSLATRARGSAVSVIALSATTALVVGDLA